MANAGALLGLLKNQGNELSKVAGAVDNYGKGRASSKVAELMASGDLEGLTPEQMQSKAMGVTNGRDMTKQGHLNLAELFETKQKNVDNTNKENAATTLFGRQNSQIAQRHGNAKSLVDYREKMTGGGTNDFGAEEYANINQEIDHLQKGIELQSDPIAINEMKKRIDVLKFNKTMGVSKNKPTRFQKEGLTDPSNPQSTTNESGQTNWGTAKSPNYSDAAMFTNLNKRGLVEKLPKEKGKTQMYKVIYKGKPRKVDMNGLKSFSTTL